MSRKWRKGDVDGAVRQKIPTRHDAIGPPILARGTFRCLLYKAEFYKRRWGIENAYKSYESMRPKTTSTNILVRVLMWFFSVVLYNLWIVARFLADRAGLCPGGLIPFTLIVFVGQILIRWKYMSGSMGA